MRANHPGSIQRAQRLGLSSESGSSADDVYPGFVGGHLVSEDDLETGLPPAPPGAVAPPRFPGVGSDFLGFHLIAELGRGTFGRVYLGRQGDLAGRLVALKVSTEVLAESQKLARMQHTHIMPIHSLHQAGTLQAVCMPFFGSTTLADVLRDLGRRESLPHSGKGLISTLEDRKSRTQATLDGSDSAPSLSAPVSNDLALVPTRLRSDGTDAPPSLRHLEKLTYVEAVLWIGSCLADGLHHAHERGIIHRDLKPANILLTDDGQPMLLDFNLAGDVEAGRSAEARAVGGTLPYMSPEHLAAFAGLPDPIVPSESARVDARSDIYSLGVILCELLTGKHPFARRPAPWSVLVPTMIAERLGPRPAIRSQTSTVSPAIEAILHKCLAPDRTHRYPTALALQEDLLCQLRHAPLRHALEPSWSERLHKWTRRHPRLSSSSSVVGVASMLLLALVLALVARSQRLGQLEARDQWSAFQEETHSARLFLASPPEDESQREEGRVLARQALGRFGVLDEGTWRDSPMVRALNDPQRQQLAEGAGEMLLLLGGTLPADEALPLNTRAMVCYVDQAPRSLWQQRADLLDRLGRADDARETRRRAMETLTVSAQDHYVEATAQRKKGNYVQAIEELRKVLALDPGHFAGWYQFGNCCLEGFTEPHGREAEAIGYFTASIALRPRFAGAWYGRGLAYLRLGQFTLAEADFSRALAFRPSLMHALVSRAKAREGLKKYREAKADLDKALVLGGPKTRLLLIRSRVHEQLNDAASSRRDREESLRLEPTEEEGWIARGVARVSSDPKGALADFIRAVEINPRSLPGLLNQAYLLTEKMGKTREGLGMLDRLLLLHPGYVTARSSRGVLLARLGRYPEALVDAKKSLEQAGSAPTVQFQVAGIFALCSRQDAKHRDESIRLLAQALKGGFGYDLIEKDDDLKPLHGDARYRSLVKAARAVRVQTGGKDPSKAP